MRVSRWFNYIASTLQDKFGSISGLCEDLLQILKVVVHQLAVNFDDVRSYRNARLGGRSVCKQTESRVSVNVAEHTSKCTDEWVAW